MATGQGGHTVKWFLLIFFLLPACESSTYKKETIKESVRDLAKREYKLDVEVKEAGKTLGVRYPVHGLFNELISEEQTIWKKIDDLMQTLSRVALSVDVPPEFLVLEVVDLANPANKIVFTQYVTDIKKIYAEALSRNQYFDRLAIEFEVNGRRTPFDQEQLDLVSLMMMAVEAEASQPAKNVSFDLSDIKMTDFLPKVAASLTRRFFRENKKVRSTITLNSASGRFDRADFKMMLDLTSSPGERISLPDLQTAVLPLVAEEIDRLFKSYRFTGFSKIVIMDKNTGAVTIAGRK